MIKKTIIALLMLAPLTAHAQLTLDRCHEKARANYPLIKQLRLVEQSRDYTLANAATGWLPQVRLSAQASYQSDVTSLPIQLPGVDVPTLAKDQYSVNLEVSQSVYDGGRITASKAAERAEANVQQAQTNVTVYQIQSRVDDMFFGILTIDDKLAQNKLLQEDLALAMQAVTSLVKGGMANQTDVDAVEVEQVNAKQEECSLLTTRNTYLRMLALFIGETNTASMELQRPEMPRLNGAGERPELLLYGAQAQQVDEQRKVLDAEMRPRFNVFVTGGYGRPGLNMLKDKFDFYYKVGATLSWNLSAFYTKKNSLRKLETQKAMIETNRSAFLLNNQLDDVNTNGTIANLKEQIARDEEIVALRTNLRTATAKKVEQGTETVNEMMRQINAVSRAKLTQAMHQTLLLRECYRLKYIHNN